MPRLIPPAALAANERIDSPSRQASERAGPSRWPLRSQFHIPGFDTSAQNAQYIGLLPLRECAWAAPSQ